MKALILSLVAASAVLVGSSANAATWYVGGVLFGNVCRTADGLYYTIYPIANGQPIGTSCPVRNPAGVVIAYGVVTAE
jgi:hypothetical protein